MTVLSVSSLGIRGQVATDVRQTFTNTFDALVTSYGASVVSYWKFHNTGVDVKGVANATISGLPELNIRTIVDTDELVNGAAQNGLCIAWTGAAGQHAQAAHNAAHKTAAGTIVVYFQRDSNVQKSTLVMADATAAQGGVSVAVNTDGSPVAYIRGVGGTPVTLTGTAGDVQLGETYALIFRWGTGGMSLLLFDANGTRVRQVSDASTIGLSGTSVIRFGGNHADTEHHDGPFARVIWMNRRITDAETTDFGNRVRDLDRPIAGYRDVELGLSPIALWGLGDAASSPAVLDDEVGSRNGQYHGVVTHAAADLPAGITGGSVNFAGTGFAIVPHDAGLLLPAFTMSLWFRIAALPGVGVLAVLVAKESAAGANDGDTSIVVTDTGAIRLLMQTAGSTFTIISADSAIALNTTYHVAARANNSGFELFLDGQQVGSKNTGQTTAWTGNTQALTFAVAAFAPTTFANVTLDEVVLYNRVLTNSEIADLAQQSLPTYADVVEGIDDLVAYWRLSNSSTIIDELGNLNGTYGGTGHALTQGLPTASDEAIDFGGAAHGTVEHDASLLLPAFTVSFWFTQHVLPQAEISLLIPVLLKESSINLSGDFAVFVDTNSGVVIRMQSGTASFTLVNEITIGTPNHLAIRADSTGFDAYLNGTYLGKNTGVASAWSANTQPLWFAQASFLGYPIGDCTLDEVAIYSRVLTQDEVFALAQGEGEGQVPVATDDTFSVNEGVTTTLNVITNPPADTFVGDKADLTVEIMGQPAGGDVATVNANNDISYSAVNVAVDTARSFTYRITDSVGTSNTATVNVTVNDTSTPPTAAAQANCYTENLNNTVVVTSMSALQTQVNAAPPGKTILIQAGTYTGGSLTFTAAGTTNAPIVIRPESGLGSVTINNAVWSFSSGSSRLVISKLYFNRSNITINGSHNRITRCRWRQIDGSAISIQAATDTRVDHNDFSGYVADIVANHHCVHMLPNFATSGTLRRVLIDYNYIHDFPTPPENPNTVNDCAFIWGGGNGAHTVNYGRVEDHNLFIDADSRTGEFINVKTSGVTIRYCTFIRAHSYLEQRQGGGWEVRSNWFEQMNSNNCLMCFDEWAAGHGPQLVIGNRVVNQDIWIASATEAGDTFVNGAYHRSREGQFIGNTCRNLYVGKTWTDSAAVFPALNNNLFNNVGTRVNLLQSGTTTLNPATASFANEPRDSSVDPWWEFTPAVKLAPADVGLTAPDPLCPSGPQS